MDKINVGFAITGSFCTFRQAIDSMKELVNKGYNIIPIMSENAYATDTRFGSADNFITEIEKLSGNKIISTVAGAEPIGPKEILDILVICPCTGNSLGKIANGIFDTSVTLGCKAHLRNERPVVVAVSSNDALGISAKSMAQLLNTKNFYFVPMGQDDSKNKPRSIVADFTKVCDTVELALQNKQIQPILIAYK